jgi:hypothetical protein
MKHPIKYLLIIFLAICNSTLAQQISKGGKIDEVRIAIEKAGYDKSPENKVPGHLLRIVLDRWIFFCNLNL